MFALLGQIEILHYFVRSAAPYDNRIVTVRRRKELKDNACRQQRDRSDARRCVLRSERMSIYAITRSVYERRVVARIAYQSARKSCVRERIQSVFRQSFVHTVLAYLDGVFVTRYRFVYNIFKFRGMERYIAVFVESIERFVAVATF